MKYLLYLLAFTFVFTSCKSNDDFNDNNPNLIDPIVNITLNLDLPEYNSLNFPGNSIVLEQLGVRGIVVYNVNNDLYSAFDLADPNHPVTSCSTMELNGIIATCPCDTDTNSYNIVTGQHQTQPDTYPMQAYQAVRTGNSIRISN
ncbi:hypothetical protein SCB49_04460 [unidentified eubacterium SCB49]|nr:hypothetical protein SCB49_04460 [unidentified eubacterium SCB49]